MDDRVLDIGDLVVLSSTASLHMRPVCKKNDAEHVFFISEKTKTSSMWTYYVINPSTGKLGPLHSHELTKLGELQTCDQSS